MNDEYGPIILLLLILVLLGCFALYYSDKEQKFESVKYKCIAEQMEKKNKNESWVKKYCEAKAKASMEKCK